MAFAFFLLLIVVPFAFLYTMGVVRRQKFSDPQVGQRAARRLTGYSCLLSVVVTALAAWPMRQSGQGPAVDLNGAVYLLLAYLGAISSIGAGLAWLCFLGSPSQRTDEGSGFNRSGP